MRPASVEPASPTQVLRVVTRLNVGGPALHIEILTDGLCEYGFETTLAVGMPGPAEGDLEGRLRRRGLDPVRIPGLGRAPRLFGDLRALWGLCRLIRRVRPTIVHTHTSKAGLLGRLAAFLCRVPVRVHTFHGHVLEGYFSPPVSLAVRLIERVLAWGTTAIVCISPLQRADLVERFEVVRPHKAHVIPLGLDLEPFGELSAQRGLLRTELGLGAETCVLGTVGRLVPIKAHDILLQAFARLAARQDDVVLCIAGDGPLRGELEQTARELGVSGRVLFLGIRYDLRSLYADLDVFVLSSRNEGTPVALIEALAAGVPAVATKVGGIPDVVGASAAAVLVEPDDPEGLAHAVASLLEDPEARAAMSTAGPGAVTGYGKARLLSDTAHLYRSLLAAKAERIQ